MAAIVVGQLRFGVSDDRRVMFQRLGQGARVLVDVVAQDLGMPHQDALQVVRMFGDAEVERFGMLREAGGQRFADRAVEQGGRCGGGFLPARPAATSDLLSAASCREIADSTVSRIRSHCRTMAAACGSVEAAM